MLPVKTELLHLQQIGDISLRYFYHQHTKYIYIQEKGAFGSIDEFYPTCSLNDILENSNGLMIREQHNL